MLNVGELSRITLELMLGLEPSNTSPEAMEARKATALDLEKMRAEGIAPDLPYDLDDLPPLRTPPISPQTDDERLESKKNLIRHNLASGMALADAFEREDREVGEEVRALAARITSLAPLTAATREQLLAEIQTNYGVYWSHLARRLRKLVRDHA